MYFYRLNENYWIGHDYHYLYFFLRPYIRNNKHLEKVKKY